MPVEPKATRFSSSSQSTASGRPLEATNDRSTDANREESGPAIDQLWSGPQDRNGSIPGDRPGDLPAEYRSLTDDRA